VVQDVVVLAAAIISAAAVAAAHHLSSLVCASWGMQQLRPPEELNVKLAQLIAIDDQDD
jgi:hypothetical protein